MESSDQVVRDVRGTTKGFARVAVITYLIGGAALLYFDPDYSDRNIPGAAIRPVTEALELDHTEPHQSTMVQYTTLVASSTASVSLTASGVTIYRGGKPWV